ncbi:protein FAM185A isoform X5 [Rhineura floridana]|uniref:protein FAM185A isoform X5 n=1 Tax=Rhineura floridana TaxID=261503 RepID=UPI002AC81F88|nr:protein FAM185A isoform X5 [Rhineura floridana]
MLCLLSRRWCMAAKIAAGNWHRLLKGGGIAGQKSYGSCQQVRLFVTSSCSCSRHPTEPEASMQKSKKSLKEWTLIVSPFGLLKVRLPCHVSVCPLDPHKYPDADRVFVAVRGMNTKPAQGADLDNLHVKYDEVLKKITIISDDISSAASVDVRTPVKFDLDIKTSGNGCVKIEKIECDSCRIETEKGTSILQSVKGQKIDIQAKGGKVICLGTLQGNADIHVSQESSVNIEKLQGSSINISTKNGLLKAKYLYAESSFLSSAAGDILLGNVHGPCYRDAVNAASFSVAILVPTGSGNMRYNSSYKNRRHHSRFLRRIPKSFYISRGDRCLHYQSKGGSGSEISGRLCYC